MSGFNGYIQLVYVLVAAMFVVGLHLMNSPATARRGNQVAQAGMVIAVVATLILLIHAGTVTATGWVVLIIGWMIPFAFVAFYPSTRLLRRDEWHSLATLAPLVAVGFGLLAALCWRLGVRKYESTGS